MCCPSISATKEGAFKISDCDPSWAKRWIAGTTSSKKATSELFRGVSQIHLSQTTKEEIRVPCWFSGDDMYDFKNDARRTVKEFRKANHDFLNDFSVLLEACSPKEKNPIQGIAKSVACQNVLFRTTTPSYSVRGLEGYLHPMVRQHRNDHVKTFLATQAVLSFGDEGSSKENKLRFLSMHTSRRSRVLARLLAHAHALQLANNPQGEDL